MVRPSKEPCKCGGQKSQIAKICWECRKKRLKRKCIICKREFFYKKSTNRQTCSKRCAYKLRGKHSRNTQSRRIAIICEYCRKRKFVSPSRSNGRFCSSNCWYRANSGRNNRLWQGGITSERAEFDTSDEWRKLRKLVWRRDNARCNRCRKR